MADNPQHAICHATNQSDTSTHPTTGSPLRLTIPPDQNDSNSDDGTTLANITEPIVLMEAGVSPDKEPNTKTKLISSNIEVSNSDNDTLMRVMDTTVTEMDNQSESGDSISNDVNEPIVLMEAGVSTQDNGKNKKRSLSSEIERVNKELGSLHTEIKQVDKSLKVVQAKFDIKKTVTIKGKTSPTVRRQDGTEVRGILRPKNDDEDKSKNEQNEDRDVEKSGKNDPKNEKKKVKRRRKRGKPYKLVNEFDTDDSSSVRSEVTTEEEGDITEGEDESHDVKTKSHWMYWGIVAVLAILAAFMITLLLSSKYGAVYETQKPLAPLNLTPGEIKETIIVPPNETADKTEKFHQDSDETQELKLEEKQTLEKEQLKVEEAQQIQLEETHTLENELKKVDEQEELKSAIVADEEHKFVEEQEFHDQKIIEGHAMREMKEEEMKVEEMRKQTQPKLEEKKMLEQQQLEEQQRLEQEELYNAEERKREEEKRQFEERRKLEENIMEERRLQTAKRLKERKREVKKIEDNIKEERRLQTAKRLKKIEEQKNQADKTNFQNQWDNFEALRDDDSMSPYGRLTDDNPSLLRKDEHVGFREIQEREKREELYRERRQQNSNRLRLRLVKNAQREYSKMRLRKLAVRKRLERKGVIPKSDAKKKVESVSCLVGTDGESCDARPEDEEKVEDGQKVDELTDQDIEDVKAEIIHEKKKYNPNLIPPGRKIAEKVPRYLRTKHDRSEIKIDPKRIPPGVFVATDLEPKKVVLPPEPPGPAKLSFGYKPRDKRSAKEKEKALKEQMMKEYATFFKKEIRNRAKKKKWVEIDLPKIQERQRKKKETELVKREERERKKNEVEMRKREAMENRRKAEAQKIAEAEEKLKAQKRNTIEKTGEEREPQTLMSKEERRKQMEEQRRIQKETRIKEEEKRRQEQVDEWNKEKRTLLEDERRKIVEEERHQRKLGIEKRKAEVFQRFQENERRQQILEWNREKKQQLMEEQERAKKRKMEEKRQKRTGKRKKNVRKSLKLNDESAPKKKELKVDPAQRKGPSKKQQRSVRDSLKVQPAPKPRYVPRPPARPDFSWSDWDIWNIQQQKAHPGKTTGQIMKLQKEEQRLVREQMKMQTKYEQDLARYRQEVARFEEQERRNQEQLQRQADKSRQVRELEQKKRQQDWERQLEQEKRNREQEQRQAEKRAQQIRQENEIQRRKYEQELQRQEDHEERLREQEKKNQEQLQRMAEKLRQSNEQEYKKQQQEMEQRRKKSLQDKERQEQQDKRNRGLSKNEIRKREQELEREYVQERREMERLHEKQMDNLHKESRSIREMLKVPKHVRQASVRDKLKMNDQRLKDAEKYEQDLRKYHQEQEKQESRYRRDLEVWQRKQEQEALKQEQIMKRNEERMVHMNERNKEKMKRQMKKDDEERQKMKRVELAEEERLFKIEQQLVATQDNDTSVYTSVREKLKMGFTFADLSPRKRSNEPQLHMVDEIVRKIDAKNLALEFKIDEIDAFLTRKHYSTAFAIYNKFLKKYPEEERLWYGRALAVNHMADKNLTEPAIIDGAHAYSALLYQSCISEATFKYVLDLTFNRFKIIRRYDLMHETMDMLRTEYPKRNDVTRKYVMSLMYMRQIQKAKDVVTQELTKTPSDGFMLVHMAHILYAYEKQYSASIPFWKKGINTLDPATLDKRFYLNYGDALQRKNDRVGASKVYKAGAERNLFLGPMQRSFHNVNSLSAHAWWPMKDTGQQETLQVLAGTYEIFRDEALQAYENNITHPAFVAEPGDWVDQGQWYHLLLYSKGEKVEKNCERVPKSCRLLEKFGAASTCHRCQIKFSVLMKGSHVIPHVGPTNCRIRNQLGLVVSEKSFIRVLNVTRYWEEGAWISYDDSFEYELYNMGDTNIMQLTVDTWHPDLTEDEKDALFPL